MPSTITHAYIGLDTLAKLKKKPKELLTKRVDNFKVYCQGTDIYYFYHIFLLKGNNVQKLGHTFHNNKTFRNFEYLIFENKKNKDPELFTFIAGLITHYKADSIMHPFINYLAHNENKLLHQDNHFEIETYLDNYFANKNIKNNHKKNKHYQLVFNYSKEDVVVKTLNNLFKDFYGVFNMGENYYKGLLEMKLVFKYLRHDQTGLKRKVYQLLDHNTLSVRRLKYLSYHFDLENDKHFLNLDKKTWFNYKDKMQTSNKSFLELYEDVINEASLIINNLYDYIFENKNLDLYALIGNNSYSTGLPLND